MGRRRRATPYFHPSSSPARVAAFLLVRHTPTNHRQPLSLPSASFFVLRYHVPPSLLLQATAFLSLLRRFLLPSASRCSNARCYNTSRTRCCRYTFFLPFSFLPRSSSAPSTRVHGRPLLVLSPHRYRFLFVYVAAILRGGTESRCIRGAFIPPSWQTRKRELRRHRKISSALDFWQTAALASSTILNSKFLRFYVRLHDTSVAFIKRKEA